jgi:enoyl-CoA hydratase
MSNNILVKFTGGATIITFDNAAGRNPLSRGVLASIEEILDESSGPIVFTGADDVFASGANLREIAELTFDTAPDFARCGQALMDRIAGLPHITIAAVNGYCLGGALDLALACKRRVASSNASFAHPGAGLGIITGWGGTQRLPRLVGSANALEMFFTAEPITAVRALNIGLVDELCVNPLENALKYIDHICKYNS